MVNKAKWNGLSVNYVKAYKTSSLCLMYGSRLSSNGQRLLKCEKCGLEFDRDVVATLNLFKPGCGEPRSPERSSMKSSQ
ncbi:MAG: hypothetical protein DRN26_01380 [Thermoplasmata archaeon]|nr:MAG: hypothetical protein DRN26_01380 [Thermoplasmata archaeon]